MADANNKPTETTAPASAKGKDKAEKKPNIFARMGKRIAKFFRDYKSEMKKISWLSAKTVRRNTLLVLVVVIIVSAAIGLLDLGFSRAIYWLGRIV